MRIVFVLLSVFTFFSCGKKITATPSKINTYEEEIKSKLNLYMEKMITGDYEAMMDITYPKLFEIAPREDLIAMLSSAFDGDEMKITFDNHKILKVHDNIVKTENRLHTLVDYTLDMSMIINKDMAEVETLMLSEFEKQHGKENVTYDKNKNTFLIKVKNQMIAVKENNEWYFLENRKEQKTILKIIFDDETLSKLGI